MDGEVKGRARLSGGALLGGVAVGAVVAAIAGWLVLERARPLPPEATAPAAQDAAAREEPGQNEPGQNEPAQAAAPAAAAGTATPAAAPADTGTAGDQPAALAPAFDTFRAAPDGAVTLAGRAAPGAEVEVLLEGAPVATARAGAGGAFALVFDVPPSDAPRALTLRAAGLVSPETLVIRPGLVTEDAAPGAGTPAPQALLADAGGVRVLAPAGAGAEGPALIIDTIAHDSGAGVTVSGRGAQPGTFLRAYLDNREAAVAEAGADGGWRVVLPGVSPGDYTLRIDALDAAGKVAARAEAPLRRDTPEALAAAGAAAAVEAAVAAVAPDPAVAAAPGAPAGQVPAAGAGVARRGLPQAQAGVPVSGAGLGKLATAAPGRGVPVSGAGLSGRAARAQLDGAQLDGAQVAGVQVDGAGPGAGPDAGQAAGQAAEGSALRVLTVVRGQSLWAIARETYGDGFLYVRVFEANRDQIRDPDLIYPGQVFTLPQ